MGLLVAWLVAIASLPFSIFVRGLCVSATWRWFVTPVTGWRTISVTESVGVSIFFSVLVGPKPIDQSKYEGKTVTEITGRMLGAVIGDGFLGPYSFWA